MKKYFVLSDIHSFYKEMDKALKESGFDIDNREHIIITCGDCFDRGPGSVKLLNFLTKMIREERAICIRGNHEWMAMEAIDRGYLKSHDFHNGLDQTIKQLTDSKAIEDDIFYRMRLMKKNSKWNMYLDHLIDYYETDKYIFVHGWIPCDSEYGGMWFSRPLKYKPDWRDSSPYEFEDASWLNGMEMWKEGIREKDKTIVCGQYHSSWGHAYLHNDGSEFLEDYNNNNGTAYARHDPFKDEGIIAMDACTALSKMVNVLVLNEDEL
ncbi:MAG: metallophosphoesterase [Erysipelotrichaceae bacterium]|nr:metallophosphoesterase [Erysipelotrichaceae bacterium]